MASDTAIAIAERQASAPERGALDKAAKEPIRRRRGPYGRRFSPLTTRILAVNVLALAMLGAGLLYLGQFQTGLIETELQALRTQGEIFAAALAEGAVIDSVDEGEQIVPELARQMMRRLVEPTRTRARLYGTDGRLLADSRMLRGLGGVVQIRELPPPDAHRGFDAMVERLYDWIVDWLPTRARVTAPTESSGRTFPEIERALLGDTGRAVRDDAATGGKTLTVAVPVQRYKHVLGAVLLSVGSGDIEQTVRQVRLDILKVFLIALAANVLLSFYLAGTIARPVRRLAAGADRVRRGSGRQMAIPDFRQRGDEIGDLSGSLREMTSALWQRMDAIERFAADVAHEIKNPLTSLRSAVETAARISDPEKQRRLLAIVMEDVQRLDRLISDISDASRLDAEMSRVEPEPVALGRMLAALVDVHEATSGEGSPRLVLALDSRADELVVAGLEGRLVQVFRNLIANAVSFSPPGGSIRLRAWRDGDSAVVAVEDEGPGIPEGKLEAIFERFYTERPRGEKFGTHSGLGLAISKQIVEAHRGAIRAENRGSGGRIEGARFLVRLPLA
jgi:two-component system sensor histidine kinase ChvG